MNRRRFDSRRNRGGKLPRNAAPVELTISHVGGRGDGVGRAPYRHNHITDEHSVFVPATLAGEKIVATPVAISGQGIRAVLHEIITASPERREPDCAAFPACGGCSFQHWQDEAATAWKQNLVTGFLARAGVPLPEVTPAHVAPRLARRRATFHLKRLSGGVAAGFLERGSDRIVTPQDCSILDPSLASLLDRLSELAHRRFPVGVSVDAQANMLDNGICLLLSGPENWHSGMLEDLAGWAADGGLCRLSVAEGGGEPLTLLAPAPPLIRLGDVTVTPPPGAFLQATRCRGRAAERGGRHRWQNARDGPLCRLRHAQPAALDGLSTLTAAESDLAALAAMKALSMPPGARLDCIEVDLMRAPLAADIFEDADAVILDPPRAGASAQCGILGDERAIGRHGVMQSGQFPATPRPGRRRLSPGEPSGN